MVVIIRTRDIFIVASSWIQSRLGVRDHARAGEGTSAGAPTRERDSLKKKRERNETQRGQCFFQRTREDVSGVHKVSHDFLFPSLLKNNKS